MRRLRVLLVSRVVKGVGTFWIQDGGMDGRNDETNVLGKTCKISMRRTNSPTCVLRFTVCLLSACR